jgi:DNA-binding transcriptional ArsR family regulator
MAEANIYESLERIFHEPNRLAIMSALCRSHEGLTFTELKQECGLTDGNLSRHLKALEESGAVTIKKSFVGAKPQTAVILASKGRQQFLHYLEALEQALKQAAASVRAEKSRGKRPGALGKPARA